MSIFQGIRNDFELIRSMLPILFAARSAGPDKSVY